MASRVGRLVPWWHIAATFVIAVAMAWPRRRDPFVVLDDAVFGLRVAAVALALGAAFVLDDPARTLLEGKPTPLWLQRSMRLVVFLPALAAAWVAVVWWMASSPVLREAELLARSTALPAVTTEFVAMVGIVVAVAAVTVRSGSSSGGLVAAPGFLVAVVVLVRIPSRWAMFPSPVLPDGDPVAQALWVDAHRRWLVVAAMAWLIALWNLADAPYGGRVRRLVWSTRSRMGRRETGRVR